LIAMGVTELACLVDFGLDFEQIQQSVERLQQLLEGNSASGAP
jgi:uncharacterized protein YoaH (UPF0181 family)